MKIKRAVLKPGFPLVGIVAILLLLLFILFPNLASLAACLPLSLYWSFRKGFARHNRHALCALPRSTLYYLIEYIAVLGTAYCAYKDTFLACIVD